jgi:hypothetical protein
MFVVEFNLSDFEQYAAELGAYADQVPFALANVMNSAAFKAREVWVQSTWPKSVKVVNPAFMNASLRVERASKFSLQVALYDSLKHDYLQRLAKGGVKRPHSARTLAIPNPNQIRKGSRGVPKSQSPSAIIAKTPKHALRITPRGLYVGEGGSLKLMYRWKDQVATPKRVPFYEDFDYVMRQELRTGFNAALARAVRTRKPISERTRHG